MVKRTLMGWKIVISTDPQIRAKTRVNIHKNFKFKEIVQKNY
jgi:hypothetical protein